MALYGPDNWGAFRKKKPFSLMGGYLGDRAGPGQNPFPGLTDPNWSGVPRALSPQYDHTMGSSAGSAAPSGAAGSGKWKKVIEQLGKMTGPEPDWSLSAQNVGVRSPWSPTNVAWSPVGADMFGRKKKKGPY